MAGASNSHHSMAPSSLHQGLRLLLRAHEYASELNCDIWDFAVELADLKKVGLASCDIRWLVCREFASHARETTSLGDSVRSFQHEMRLVVRKSSCFVLTNAGVEFAKKAMVKFNAEEESIPFSFSTMLGCKCTGGDNEGRVRTNPQLSGSAAQNDVREMTPKWDCDRQELRFRHDVVKVFKLNSPNQATILAAFEEEGWPTRIDDPLPHHSEIDPKQRLHDTIKSLNRNQKRRLIRFRGDGTGQGIRWELRSAPSQQQHPLFKPNQTNAG